LKDYFTINNGVLNRTASKDNDFASALESGK
jgi:hypothetical protein